MGDRGFGTDIFDPLTVPVVPPPPGTDPRCIDTAIAKLVAQHRDELAAVIVEPSVQGAAGMLMAEPADFVKLCNTRAANTTCC